MWLLCKRASKAFKTYNIAWVFGESSAWLLPVNFHLKSLRSINPISRCSGCFLYQYDYLSWLSVRCFFVCSPIPVGSPVSPVGAWWQGDLTPVTGKEARDVGTKLKCAGTFCSVSRAFIFKKKNCWVNGFNSNLNKNNAANLVIWHMTMCILISKMKGTLMCYVSVLYLTGMTGKSMQIQEKLCPVNQQASKSKRKMERKNSAKKKKCFSWNEQLGNA